MEILTIGPRQSTVGIDIAVINAARLASAFGKDAAPSAYTRLSPVMRDIVKFWGVAPPLVVKSVAGAAGGVVMVGHNDLAVSAPDISEANVVAVVDNHRMSGFRASHPAYIRLEPVASVNTILTELYQERGVMLSPLSAGLLLTGIWCDTRQLTADATTEKDQVVAAYLADRIQRDRHLLADRVSAWVSA